MKSSRITSFLCATVTGIAAGIAGPAQANPPIDDTEVYLGVTNVPGQTIKPNVLFVIDTSGSMSTQVPNTGLTRLENMQSAFDDLLSSLNNVNAGLMRFNQPGGPILYPVADLDADATVLEGTNAGGNADVAVRINQSTDDAEEVASIISGSGVSVGSMTLTSPSLEMTRTAGTSSPATITKTVAASTDDAEQRKSNGCVSTSSTVLDLINDSGAVGSCSTGSAFDQLVGLRFANLNIPLGAQITSAKISFTVQTRVTSGTTLTIFAQDDTAPATFSTANNNLGTGARPREPSSVIWSGVPAPNVGSALTTPDLSALVQRLVCSGAPASALITAVPPGPCTSVAPLSGGAWTALASSIAFIIDGINGSRRVVCSFDNTSSTCNTASKRPTLTVTYQTSAQVAQKIGLRFQNVNVPKGATVTSAFLEFNSFNPQGCTVVPCANEGTTGDTSLVIKAQAIDDAPTFTANNADISGRTLTASSVTWDGASNPPLVPWTHGPEIDTDTGLALPNAYDTPDLKNVVQEVVNRSGWCGGNNMAFVISEPAGALPPQLRTAIAADSNLAFSPVLRINFDHASVPPGACNNTHIQSQVRQSTDDAEQINASPQSTVTTNSTLGLGSNSSGAAQTVGVRFEAVGIPQGATIVNASIQFSASGSSPGGSVLTIKGQDADNASVFAANSANISGRTVVGPSVSWTTPAPWSDGQSEQTPDVATIVQAIVNRSGWKPGNTMAFTFSGTNRSTAYSYEGNPALAPVLKATYIGGAGHPTVRDRLRALNSQLTASGNTPSVDTLYEAARYYRGEGVDYGRTRGSPASPFKRVSNPISYTGGTVVRQAGCTDLNLNASQCTSEQITGNPIYTSPISDKPCQPNYIVFMTDGIPTENSAVTKVQSMTGVTCKTPLASANPPPTGTQFSFSSEAMCGVELASFLNTKDQSTPIPGDQTVKTYTIGFNLCPIGQVPFGTQCCAVPLTTDSDGNLTCPSFAPDPEGVNWLKQVAAAGGGTFGLANTAGELTTVFNAIVASILSQPTSFATPSLTVNAFNKLFNRNEVYFSLFIPSTNDRWPGNVKKYSICDKPDCGCGNDASGNPVCPLGAILDVNGNPAIAADKRISDTAKSIWSDVIDGIDIKKGGAASVLLASSLPRTMFAFTDPSLPPGGVNLNQPQYLLDKTNPALTAAMLGVATTARDNLIDWIRGVDVDNEDGDVSTLKRFPYEDPLHASPIAVEYGGSDTAPVDKLFVVTNGGMLRMLNAFTGTEEWTFMPSEMLSIQQTLRSNQQVPIGGRHYGLDSTPAFWTNDANANSQIEPGGTEFVRVFFGQRDGGRNYYAVEADPTTTIPTAPTDTERAAIPGPGNVLPKFLWEIKGGTTGFENLGKTWSIPKVTKIRMVSGGANTTKMALIFGGGNDNTLDNKFGTNAGTENIGNILYIVDAATGSLITSIGGNGTTAKLKVTGMNYPIPSDIATLDSNGDGATDRLYFGDLGGRLWRIDLREDLQTSSTGSQVGVVGLLADLSIPQGAVPGAGLATETRSFYSAPDVVQVEDTEFSTEGRYDLVLIGSGSRPHPLDEAVHNKFYAFRDFTVSPMQDGGNGIATGFPLVPTGNSGTTGTPFHEGDLFDVTNAPFQKDLSSNFINDTSTTLPSFKSKSGWIIQLKEPDGTFIGEKVVSRPVVLAGKLFFTTYVPGLTVELLNQCKAAEGSGRLYGLDVLNGSALFANWDSGGDKTHLSASDRTLNLGGGVPSDAVPVFQKSGVTIIVGGGGGATTVDPHIALPRERTYWYER